MTRRPAGRCALCIRVGLALLAIPLLAAAQDRAAAASAASILARQSPEVVTELYEEKVVLLPAGIEAISGRVRALVIFEQPVARVMRLLSQTARQSEFRPELKSIETIEWYEGGNVDEHELRIMFVKMRYRLRNDLDFERRRIRWQLDPDFQNDPHHIEGSWELYDLDDVRTLGRFSTQVNVGAALPLWLQEFATRKNVPKTLENMRRWVDSNGSYRP